MGYVVTLRRGTRHVTAAFDTLDTAMTWIHYELYGQHGGPARVTMKRVMRAHA